MRKNEPGGKAGETTGDDAVVIYKWGERDGEQWITSVPMAGTVYMYTNTNRQPRSRASQSYYLTPPTASLEIVADTTARPPRNSPALRVRPYWRGRSDLRRYAPGMTLDGLPVVFHVIFYWPEEEE